MPDLITGKACTDVTGELYDRVMESIRNDEKAIVIVPDQFVFETEKALFRRCAAKDLTTSFPNISVCTIARISDEIVSTYQKGKPPADEITKNVIMYQAIHNRGVQLSSLGRLAKKQGFAAQMVKTVSLLKTEGIDCARFREFLDSDEAKAQPAALLKKMSDISALYTEYDQMLSSKYTDKLDVTMLAADLAVRHGYFSDKNVFVDGFNSFSGSQLRLMKAISERSKNSCFAFVADKNDDRDIFSTVLTEIDRISENGLPESSDDNSRGMSEELKLVSELLWNGSESDDRNISALRVIKADDIYAEMEFIAAEIRRLVSSEGLRYNQIAVLSTDPAEYRTPAESSFTKYDIPMFCDIPESILNAPLTNLVLSLLKLIDDPSAENFLSYIRNSYLHVCCEKEVEKDGAKKLKKYDRGLYINEIDSFDNYIMRWCITGQKLEKEFATEGMGESDQKLAERAEKVRKMAVVPVLELRNRITAAINEKTCTAAWLSKEICTFLFNEAGIEHAVLDSDKNASTLWDILVQIFEAICTGIGDNKLTPGEYYTLFRDICSQTSLALPPQLVDSVILGDTGRTRADGIKAVFIAGANYGKFPDPSDSFGLFSEYEAEILSETQLRFSMKQEEKYTFSRYQAYRALTLATDRLYLTYSVSKPSGGVLAPCEVITDLLTRFSRLRTEYAGDSSAFGDDFYCSTKKALRARYASQFGGNDQARLQRLRKAMELSGDKEYADHLDQLVKARPTAFRHRIDPSVANDLFRSHYIAATKLERLSKCRFLYFCENGLKIRIRTSMNAYNNDVGSAVHHVLENVLKKYCTSMPEFFNLSKDELKKLSKDYLNDYENQKLGGKMYHSNSFNYMFSGLELRCADLLELLQMEFRSRKYRPVLFEAEFRDTHTVKLPAIQEEKADVSETQPDENNAGSKPAAPVIEPLISSELVLSPLTIDVNGITVSIIGVVDRIDMFHGEDGKDYLRIVDYKTGSHKFKISNAIYGINTQMLIYLIAVCNANQNIAPGGVGYFSAKMTDAALSESPLMEMIVSGHLPSDMYVKTESTEAEQNQFAAGYINAIYGGSVPVSADSLTSRDVTPADSAVPDPEEYRKLIEQVLGQTKRVLTKLYNGDVYAVPTIYKDGTAKSENKQCPCDYCSFKSLCGREEPYGCYVDEKVTEELVIKPKETKEPKKTKSKKQDAPSGDATEKKPCGRKAKSPETEAAAEDSAESSSSAKRTRGRPKKTTENNDEKAGE